MRRIVSELEDKRRVINVVCLWKANDKRDGRGAPTMEEESKRCRSQNEGAMIREKSFRKR
jgi:hypothetical protein